MAYLMMLQGTTQIKEKQEIRWEYNVEEWIGLDFSSAQRAISNGRIVESNCCMTPKKLQESVLWHFYVLLGP